MPLISEKLPTDIGLIIARKFKSEVWYLNEITEVLKQIEAKNKTKQNKNKKKKQTHFWYAHHLTNLLWHSIQIANLLGK